MLVEHSPGTDGLQRLSPPWPFSFVATLKAARRSLMAKVDAAADLARSPDRVLLVDAILPALGGEGGRVLFVGVRAYTQGYPAILEAGGGECWTLDRDPRAERYGVGERHVTADVRCVGEVWPAARFNAVVGNGLFGFGLNTRSQQADALAAMAVVLRVGGRLVLGWNTSRASERAVESLTTPLFDARPLNGLPVRVVAAGTDHAYGFFAKRGG